ncbi:tRNA pseudouridine(38-40) synthase TruA [Agaribacterium haliotis]|uniref:tRNA pseudouridine(38-40) synthase TruA n=1 Tax=Agaribacterium haliotis TaxID=2013869 RepID=UPI000BB597B9|nr:tRNA pseudouridine(38-40) synthase TruA [Agaribacterium haliotis]
MSYSRNCEIKTGVSMPEGMRRIAIGLEYAGADFNGFQRQKSTANTVQEALESALTAIACEPITSVCAGRTDAGVHATGQVLHFDTLAERPDKAWQLGVNTKLPDSIRVQWARQVEPEFHARFSAGSRTYRYVGRCSRARSAVLGRQVSHFSYELNLEAMQRASSYLLGEHDFSAFRAAQCQAHSPVRKLEFIRWYRQGQLWVMEVQANAFLHHMVRNIVGSLVEVGRGAQDPEWIKTVLESRDRCLAGATAPPWGLYLVDVAYPQSFGLPQFPVGPSFLALSADNRC